MADHPNAQLVRDAYEGGPEAAVAALADNVKWHFPGGSRVAGDFEGREAVLAHIGELMAAFSVELFHVMADDRFVVAIEHVTGEGNGNTYDRHDVVVFRIKDGKVAEGWAYPENLHEIEAVLA